MSRMKLLFVGGDVGGRVGGRVAGMGVLSSTKGASEVATGDAVGGGVPVLWISAVMVVALALLTSSIRF